MSSDIIIELYPLMFHRSAYWPGWMYVILPLMPRPIDLSFNARGRFFGRLFFDEEMKMPLGLLPFRE